MLFGSFTGSMDSIVRGESGEIAHIRNKALFVPKKITVFLLLDD